jgi:hypothetical protein
VTREIIRAADAAAQTPHVHHPPATQAVAPEKFFLRGRLFSTSFDTQNSQNRVIAPVRRPARAFKRCYFRVCGVCPKARQWKGLVAYNPFAGSNRIAIEPILFTVSMIRSLAIVSTMRSPQAATTFATRTSPQPLTRPVSSHGDRTECRLLDVSPTSALLRRLS